MCAKWPIVPERKGHCWPVLCRTPGCGERLRRRDSAGVPIQGSHANAVPFPECLLIGPRLRKVRQTSNGRCGKYYRILADAREFLKKSLHTAAKSRQPASGNRSFAHVENIDIRPDFADLAR